MKKKWFFLVVLVLIPLVLAGCKSINNKPTGQMALSFTVPEGPSEYPPFPPHESASRASNDVPYDVHQRAIPAGTHNMKVTIYNETTNWSCTETINIIEGKSTYNTVITGIPAASGYTVEVIPSDDQGWSIAMGRAENMIVSSDSTTSLSITLQDVWYSDLSYTSTVSPGGPITISVSLNMPFAILSDNSDGLWACIVDDLLDPTDASFWVSNNAIPSLPADSWVDVEINASVPDVTGTFYLYGIDVDYIQPVTETRYYLGCIFDPAPVISIGGSGTGSF